MGLSLFRFNIVVANMSFASVQQQPTCRDKERSALLQFKESFVITKYAYSFAGAYPKVLQWKSSNSCLWGGIDCDAETDNHFNFSQIPASIGQLSHLTYLNLSGSAFYGQVPFEISDLTNLSSLDMTYNYDPVTEEKFLQLKDPNFKTLVRNLTKLEIIILRFVDMSSESHLSPTWRQQFVVDLWRSKKKCNGFKIQASTSGFLNLRNFPHFLKHQNELDCLVLDGNNIDGQIPNWMLNIGINTLTTLNIASNLPTGFEQLPVVLPWVNLGVFDISSNMLQGPLPIPPPSIARYDVSNNMLTGEISPLFCNMSSLYILDLSNNNLCGIIPPCLRNSGSSQIMLSLRNNSLHGITLEICSNNGSNLKMSDVSHNLLQGKLPRSLSNCLMLEAIVVVNNQLHDSFPSCL
nr:receptor-like protein 38 [Ziziphus jujuba var. spinosa]